MNLSEKEKRAIEELKMTLKNGIKKHEYEECKTPFNELCMFYKNDNIVTVLKLIEKLQKENKELKDSQKNIIGEE